MASNCAAVVPDGTTAKSALSQIIEGIDASLSLHDHDSNPVPTQSRPQLYSTILLLGTGDPGPWTLVAV